MTFASSSPLSPARESGVQPGDIRLALVVALAEAPGVVELIAGHDANGDAGDVLPHDYPLETLEPGLEEQAYYDPVNFSFPGGAHIAEVEIDPDTCIVKLVNYTAVDDIGTVINPMIVEGQLHGGIAQGIGQALCENCVYDSASGQLLSGSFMDYCVPRADDLPRMTVSTHSTPSAHTPMGVKGCGEVGTIGSPAAVTNAVVDALSQYGVSHIDMPTTPNRIWSLISTDAPARITRLTQALAECTKAAGGCIRRHAT